MKPTPEDTNPLEQALKHALRREAAPENLATQVLARVAQQTSARKAKGAPLLADVARSAVFRFAFFSQPLVRWAAFATVAICLVAEGVHYRNVQHERAKGEAAKQQLMLALRIAGSKLQLAKERVNEINRQESHSEPKTPRSRS